MANHKIIRSVSPDLSIRPSTDITVTGQSSLRKIEWREIVGIPVIVTSIPSKTDRYDALVLRWDKSKWIITGHVTRAPKSQSQVVWRPADQIAVADLPVGVDGCQAVMQVIDKSVELIALRAK